MRIRKIFPLLLAGVIGTAAPMSTYAATTEEQIADAQAQKEAAQTQLAQQQANMQQQMNQAQPSGWTCACGASNTGNFCSNCGKPKPSSDWTCACGTVNKGNFCCNCGKPRA